MSRLKPAKEKMFWIMDFADIDGIDISRVFMEHWETGQETVHGFSIPEALEMEEDDWSNETTVKAFKEMARQLIEAGCDPEEDVLIHVWW